MKTFKHYNHTKIMDEKNNICHGDYVIENTMIVRINDGYLDDTIDENGIVSPAIESLDGTHLEHWKKGVLHLQQDPAVEDKRDNRREWWENGRQLKTEKWEN